MPAVHRRSAIGDRQLAIGNGRLYSYGMTVDPYLVQLNGRLAESLADWPEARREGYAAFLRSRQEPGGGFAGRAGSADLYYTAFGLRGLAVVGGLKMDVCLTAARFLMHQQPTNIIDFLSYLFSWWMLAGHAPAPDTQKHAVFTELLESHRCPDGGYGKAPGALASSTYHTFLAALSYDLMGGQPPEGPRLEEFVRSRRRGDGGFAELAQMPHSSINPTAAGAAMAVAGGWADDAVIDGVSQFLVGAQREDGGWPASPRTPASDLLSTFTAMLTLSDLGSLDQARLEAAQGFIESCGVAGQGFAGSPGDDQPDVEYTFYGLGAQAILK